MKNFLVTLLSLFTFSATAATSPKEAYAMVKEDQAVMIDVREEDEIKSGMIDKALWFPKSKIDGDKDWLKDFQAMVGDKKIFLYCRSGARSQKVLNILKTNGISSENLGGYESLKKEIP